MKWLVLYDSGKVKYYVICKVEDDFNEDEMNYNLYDHGQKIVCVDSDKDEVYFLHDRSGNLKYCVEELKKNEWKYYWDESFVNKEFCHLVDYYNDPELLFATVVVLKENLKYVKKFDYLF